ncbi:MAG: DegT/DnrJ/EryC1/StrS family aminotransferase [Alphaproteobacteria bacterium]|nr:DegT/DnrJ/EryC1/StrS family aminotransferase [Alphaproteobacteria bacterium]
MPGFEVIGIEEQQEVDSIFSAGGGVLFRHGFEKLRNHSYKVKEFEYDFGVYIGNPNTLAVSSGTAALRVAIASLNLSPGDEIITQSFTFVATAEAIVESSCIPVFTEIDETLNMDPRDLEIRITPKTKAVIVVHMLGTPANLTEIKNICKNKNLYLIEDTAWGCGGEYDEKKLGTIGDIGCFSFDFAKTITTGEGGMVVFKDSELFKKGAAYHDHGHENNPNLPRWEDSRSSSGFNYRMSELQGAVGKAQLKKLDYIVNCQRENASKIKKVIGKYDYYTERHTPSDSFGTADAFVFFSKSVKPIEIRKALLKNGISTKILPEANTWHFAQHWDHIVELDTFTGKPLGTSFNKSADILNSAVSIPISVNPSDKFIQILETTFESIHKDIV